MRAEVPASTLKVSSRRPTSCDGIGNLNHRQMRQDQHLSRRRRTRRATARKAGVAWARIARLKTSRVTGVATREVAVGTARCERLMRSQTAKDGTEGRAQHARVIPGWRGKWRCGGKQKQDPFDPESFRKTYVQ